MKLNLKNNMSPDVGKRQGLKDMLKRDIYLSWWIANLGVVPLLLFSAFLFLPALVFLRALLFFVTRVLETISFLLQPKQLCELSRIKYLPRLISSVKAFALMFLTQGILAHATSPNSMENQTLILSIGEIKEISVPGLDRFIIGNNDSLSHKFIQKNQLLVLKAKKLGLCELSLWMKDGGRKKYQIYVLSRNNQLKLLGLAESLKSLGLEVELKGPWVQVSGELLTERDYIRFQKIKNANSEKLQLSLGLAKELKKKLLSSAIKSLFDDHINEFKCGLNQLDIICHISSERLPSPEVEKHLKDSLGVKFVRHLTNNRSTNYQIKIKIIQIESSDGQSHGFGLNQLSGDLKSLFDNGWQALYEKNRVVLRDLGVEAGLLAEPVSLIRANRKLKIQVGAEIPYSKATSDGVETTDFKFAGLKLDLILKKEGDGFLIDYSTEITKPGNNGEISGSKESASARINLGEPIDLFEINFRTDVLNKESFPIMGKIPLLGKLFSNSNKNKAFKKITGYILLEKK